MLNQKGSGSLLWGDGGEIPFTAGEAIVGDLTVRIYRIEAAGYAAVARASGAAAGYVVAEAPSAQESLDKLYTVLVDVRKAAL